MLLLALYSSFCLFQLPPQSHHVYDSISYLTLDIPGTYSEFGTLLSRKYYISSRKSYSDVHPL